ARVEPLARPLHRRRSPLTQQKLRQGRRRAQDPDRRLAHALPQRTLQPRATHHLCLGKLPLCFGRLTAPYGIEKPRQLPPTRCARQRQERDEHPTVREQQRRCHRPSNDLTRGPSSERAERRQPTATAGKRAGRKTRSATCDPLLTVATSCDQW